MTALTPFEVRALITPAGDAEPAAPAEPAPTSAPTSTPIVGPLLPGAPNSPHYGQRRDATADAYMLMYRRRDVAAPATAVPADLRATVEAENAANAALRRTYAMHRAVTELRVLAPECPGAAPDAAVALHGDHTLDEAVARAARALGVADAGHAEVRLRRWNTGTNRGGETFQGKGTSTLRALGLCPAATLRFEARPQPTDPPFADFDKDAMHLRFAPWVEDEETEVGHIDSALAAEAVAAGGRAATVGAARAAARVALRLSDEVGVMLVSPGGGGALLADDALELVRDLNVWAGATLVVETVPAAAAHGAESRALASMRREADSISVSFNDLKHEDAAAAAPAAAAADGDKPGDQPGGFLSEIAGRGSARFEASVSNRSVETALSTTVADLKALIAAALDLDPAAVHLKRSKTGPQLKDETKTLRSVGVTNNGFVCVGHGAPCRPDETLVDLVVYAPGKKPAVRTLGSVAVRGEGTVADLRALAVNLLLKEGTHAPELATPLRVRLRDKKGRDPGAILRGTRKLSKALVGLTDGRAVAVQLLDHDESLALGQVVVTVRAFDRLAGKLRPPADLVVNRDDTVSALRAALDGMHLAALACARAGEGGADASSDAVGVATCPTFGQPLGVKKLVGLKWNDPSWGADDVLGRPPVSLRDGTLLVVRSEHAWANAADAEGGERREGTPETPPSKAGRVRSGRANFASGKAGGGGGGGGSPAYRPAKEKALSLGGGHFGAAENVAVVGNGGAPAPAE